MNFCGLQVKMYYNNNTLFKYIYANKHDIRYMYQKVDREVIHTKGPLTEL